MNSCFEPCKQSNIELPQEDMEALVHYILGVHEGRL